MTESEILRFVLGGCGEVELLEPSDLRKTIAESAQSVLSCHKGENSGRAAYYVAL